MDWGDEPDGMGMPFYSLPVDEVEVLRRKTEPTRGR